jgi:hypothetical protein
VLNGVLWVLRTGAPWKNLARTRRKIFSEKQNLTG